MSSSQQPSGHRRGLISPISTAFNNSNSNRSTTSTNSPSRNTFSPTNSNFPQFPQPSSRTIASRNSSASSTSTPFSPSHSGSQQLPQNSLLSSVRARNIAPSSQTSLGSSAAALPSTSQGGGPASGAGGGGATRLARASPSLSQSSGVGSPNPVNNLTSAPPGQSLSKIVIAQVFLLLSSMKEDKDKMKWDGQADQIRKLIDSNGMEVFSKYFRRLLQSNAAQIFGTSRSAESTGNYQMLVGEMQKITQNPEQAYKIAESIDTPEGDLFRDFDLSAFMEHFKLDSVAKATLALACKSASKSDLRTKADAILSNNIQSFISIMQRPSLGADDEVPPAFLVPLLDRLFQDPPRNWSEDVREKLSQAVRLRYAKMHIPIPPEVSATLHLGELLGPHNPLVKLVQRAGQRATSSLETCKEMLATAELRDISYQQVASVLLFMVITENGQAYNPTHFVSALREHRAGQRLDWQDVVHAFDRKGLRVTKDQFLSLYNALLPLAREYENFDIQLLWGGSWANEETQLSFAVAYLSCNSDELDVSGIPRLRKAFTVNDFEDAREDVRDYVTRAVLHPLISLDAVTALFKIIFKSQETYGVAQSLEIPKTVINANTDIFIVSASAVPKPWLGIQEQALRQLFWPFLSKSLPNYDFVLYGLWKQNSLWLADRLTEAYQLNPLNLLKIFEHAETHGWLDPFIRLNSGMSLDLAALAHGRGVFDIKAWAEEMFQQHPHIFAGVLYKFLEGKAETDLSSQREKVPPSVVPLTVKTVHTLVECQQGHLTDEQLVQLQRICIQAYPRLINYGEGFDEIIDTNGKDGNAISEDADAQMQEHFKNMYSQESDVKDIIVALQTYKNSSDPAEQDLFACMIQGLFDEYSCFGEYPLEALATTAVLFGGIINFNLLSRIALQAGLAMVLESVQLYSPEDSMYKFGLQALLHFQGRLHEWPAFCDRLLRVPGLHGTEIWPVVENVVRRQHEGDLNGEAQNGPLGLSNGTVDDFLGSSESPNVKFTCLHVDPPLSDDYEEPDEEVQDKVLFVLNNVSERNIKDKLKDLKEVLEAKHHQWFATYLVEERAKLQPNYQQLYLDLLQLFDEKVLWAEVLRETYVSVVRMLNAESTMNSTTERNHLKNLGGWLGSLTIARDKPIKFKNISFKDLLVEGHDTQRLIIVIPFTCKVLFSVTQSTIFKPPNPWTMEVIRILIELYHFADLKLNQKFEIEVLCKELDLDHNMIEPAQSIRSRPVPEEEFLPPVLGEHLDGFNDLPMVGMNRARGPNERFSPAVITAALPDFSQQLVFPPSTGSANVFTQNRLRQIFLAAAQQAIMEIIAPVVERSVTIAAISTAQVVLKDFAFEVDVEKLQRAAHTMVKSLAGSLALVTCKEPLRMSITNNIRIMGRDPETNTQLMPEGLILMFVNDNLDKVCGLVEHAAETQSIAEINMQLEGAIRDRKIHLEMRPTEPYMDREPGVNPWAIKIAEPYKQTPGGLNPEQLAIYEEFDRPNRSIPSHLNTASQDSGRVSDVLQEQLPIHLQTPAEAPAVPRQPTIQQRLPNAPASHGILGQPQMNGYIEPHTLNDRVQDLIHELLRLSKDSSEESIEDLAQISPIREVFDQLVHTIDNAGAQKDQLSLSAAVKICGFMYSETERQIEADVLVQLLSQLCHLSIQTARQVVTWLANLENDDRVFNALVTMSLLSTGLMDLRGLDTLITRALRERRHAAVEFLSNLIDLMILNDHPSALRADFARSYEALTQWLAEDPEFEIGRETISKIQLPQEGITLPSPPSVVSQDQFEYIFEEWIHLQRLDAPQKANSSFVRQLYQKKILKSLEETLTFMRVCTEASVAAYEQEATLYGNLDEAYVHVDALAELIVSVSLSLDEQKGVVKTDKAVHLDAILSAIILTLCDHHHKRVDQFNQKVFFRLFSSLIYGLHMHHDDLSGFQDDVMIVIGKALLALQPSYFPGFSFAWLTLVANRMFMPAMLKLAGSTGWEMYSQLIELALAHAGDLVKPVHVTERGIDFYRGVLRVLLVIHHDFPEFLAENHFRLCNGVPSHCIQLRNLIVSAYPSTYPELPDPFSDGLKVDRLEEIRNAPIIRGDTEEPLRRIGLIQSLDHMLEHGDISDGRLEKICQAVYNSPRNETEFGFAPVKVDTVLLHSLVLYIGEKAISAAGKGPIFNVNSPAAKVLENLVKKFRPEARYHFISAMANQLRWPNSHTHYFTYALLHLFGSPTADQETLETTQQITRVLLERLLVHRPHPWGLIITLLEVLKNPAYQFWDLPFIKAAPEVSSSKMRFYHVTDE
ncbi:Not1-domain-containing protein [Patellaria atrata CBS 101060]|uniref:General negative regulator of transcription subunit 1 n=1 Tax=Patellaria atrata CBS 101060 TaxID=1346257 RepID=A0A9P4VV20_9PEZI|nr:Not1-domain-containing protein [Patellaria atrata CBS 101060]